MAPRHLAPSIILLAWLAMPNAWAASSLVDLGKSRAIESCSACHQVTAGQKRPAPVPNPDEFTMIYAPSFFDISTKYKGHDQELRAFIKTPEHPMKEQKFLDSDLNAIVAYIHSLDTNHR